MKIITENLIFFSYFKSSLGNHYHLLSFSMIAKIFVNAKEIYSLKTYILSQSYIDGLLCEIKAINQNKNTKLKTIYIKCRHTDLTNLNLCSKSFKSLNWPIRRDENSGHDRILAEKYDQITLTNDN